MEYVARAEGGGPDASQAVGNTIRAICAPAYEVVQGICNGMKHAGSDRGRFGFTPGHEMIVDLHRTYTAPAFPLGTVLVAANIASGHMPMVVDHAGKLWGIDHCVQAVLSAFVKLYPQHLGTVDLSCLDVQFRLTPP